MTDIFAAHKRENSPVPLPSSHLPPKAKVETLEARVARGDYTAILTMLTSCVASLETWQKTIANLPDVPLGTVEGRTLLSFKQNVLPSLTALVADAKTRLPPK